MEENNISYPEDFNFGYDLEQEEKVVITTLDLTEQPSSFLIDSSYLPPIGSQGRCPSCVAWGGIYGMVSYWSAVNNGTDPSLPQNQASPGFIYIKAMQNKNEPSDQCSGSNLYEYFPILQADQGTPNIVNAPYTNGEPMGRGECSYLWQEYASATPTIDSTFNIPSFTAINTKDVVQVKQALLNGSVVAYGTRTYTDFATYHGTPMPYVGNGILKHDASGKLAGHCMMVIGYDDNCGSGAFLIQNSFGTGWGSNGTFWVAYDTYTTLAQGTGCFIPNNNA